MGRFRWGFCCGLGLFAGAAVYAQTPPVEHIEVIARPYRAASGQLEEAALRSGNFQVFQAGKRLPVQVSNGTGRGVAVHVLLVTADAAGLCGTQRPAELDRFVNAGWVVRIVDAAGRESSPLAAGAGCSFPTTTPGADAALTELQAQPGRRIVVFYHPAQPERAAAAARGIAEVYAVDGGVEHTSFQPLFAVHQTTPVLADNLAASPATVPCHEIGPMENPNSLCHVGTSSVTRREAFRDGVLHEKTLHAALTRAWQAREGYLDITLAGPATSPLELRFHHAPDLNVAVARYGSGGRDGTRQAAAGPLSVGGR